MAGAFPIDSAAEEEVLLGVATSLTLLEGQESFNAVKMAVAEINAKGGVKAGGKIMPIRIESVDLRDASPQVPVSHSLRTLDRFMREKKVHAVVVGPFRSEVLLAGMDMIAERKIPLLGTIAMSAASEAKIMKDPKYRN